MSLRPKKKASGWKISRKHGKFDAHQRIERGRLAQLGERGVRNAEVGSSSLLPSTILFPDFSII